MFPSHLPVPIILHMLLIGICVIVALIVLQNPLAMLGLLLMPSLPVVNEGCDHDDDDDEKGRPMGFTADL